MASSDDSKKVQITSLNEQRSIKTFNLHHSVNQMAFINQTKSLALYSRKKNYFQIVDMDYPSRDDTSKTASSIKFNIFRQLVQGSEKE